MRALLQTKYPEDGLAGRWNAFLADADFATHYVTPNFFLDPYVRENAFAIIVEDAKGAIAAIATGNKEGKCASAGLFSRPQLVISRNADLAAVLPALAGGLDKLDVELSEIYSFTRLTGFDAAGFSERESTEATSVVMLDLSLGAEALFSEFSQTRRNEIRKAERRGDVEISEIETEAEFEEFFAIHLDWKARKRETPDTREQMRTAISQRENRRYFIAKVAGKVVAGSIYRFCPGGVVEYAANFSLPEFQRHRPNDLIGWHAIKWACDEGLKQFSMGGSHLFLRRFGGGIVKTYRYRRDTSFLARHTLKESALEMGHVAYTRLPQNVRDGVRRILAR